MSGYSVQVIGAQSIIAKLDAVGYLKPVAPLLNELSLVAQTAARNAAPKDTGTLKRSIVRDLQPLMARVYSPLGYAPVMEYGRAPGSAMPPPDALAGWAKRHGIPASALFVLARAIARRGIKGRFFMKAGTEAVTSAMPAAVAKAAAAIEAIWGAGDAAGGA